MKQTQTDGGRSAKQPRTKRGEATRAKILDAARIEFGKHGFADSSIAAITQRAKVALGTFYTYFDSKEEVFSALVADMSRRVAEAVGPAIAGVEKSLPREEAALGAFLRFARTEAEVYRIIDEAEFVDPQGFERHYRTTAARMRDRLDASGDLAAPQSDLDAEVRAWALMGMNVFLGLRFAVWGDEDPQAVAAAANRLLANGLR
ncbi:TetR/AcrR family transcriptional regulator [Sphingomicrobium aestuariivivum]|uniref:TetR/AcrR family transcriptional regulator n=1 Tax=Sphingomicrobium aestuariivivum TaxID=1582356 RepID=UPI001FD6F9A5|nr:TetR/AcrR family transcriptional regulator [Sphingomicrobium aestuariivivum]MCJ8191213.1 TetR/AcrR family transcriptional regulator [Sphingomicrobium aestuariivivum]